MTNTQRLNATKAMHARLSINAERLGIHAELARLHERRIPESIGERLVREQTERLARMTAAGPPKPDSFDLHRHLQQHPPANGALAGALQEALVEIVVEKVLQRLRDDDRAAVTEASE